MKITSIRVYRAEMPLQYPCRLSGGRLHFDKLDSTDLPGLGVSPDESLPGDPVAVYR